MPIDVQFPGNLGQVDTIAKLRAVPTSGVDAETVYIAMDVGRTYSFDFGSLLNDDGINVIRPNDRTPLQAGRFIYLVDGFAPGKPGEPGPAGQGLADVMTPTGASLVGFRQAGTSAVTRNVLAKAQETVSITDFGASSSSADNTAAIQAAIDAVFAAGGGTVEIPLGKYDFTSVTQKAGVRLVGKGYGSRLHSTNSARSNGINASGPDTSTRIAGMSIENVRLTSAFVRGGTAISGNAIRWLWVKDSTIANVWVESWSDSAYSITDSDRVSMTNLFAKTVTQGVDVFNDSHDCTLTGFLADDIFPYVALNVEGLAANSAFRPKGFVGTNIRATRFGTHGINLVNADYPVVSGWSVSGGIGNAEGPGNGVEVYGCLDPVLTAGVAYGNAGYGVKVGPTQDGAVLGEVRTRGNAMGGLLVTDAGGNTSQRVGVAGCKFEEGPPTLVGNSSIENVMAGLTVNAALPTVRMKSTSATNRNTQIVSSSAVDAEMLRVGWDVYTNNGTPIFQAGLDTYGGQIFGVQVDSITGANDNSQSLGRSDRRFSTVYAGTGTINTSDRRHKNSISDIPDEWLDAWADVKWRRFKFNDGTRWHIGLIAQEIVEAFEAKGLDATEIGLVCHDTWDAEPARPAETDGEGNVIVPAYAGREAGDLWSVRMSECLAMDAALRRRVA